MRMLQNTLSEDADLSEGQELQAARIMRSALTEGMRHMFMSTPYEELDPHLLAFMADRIIPSDDLHCPDEDQC